MTHLVSASPGWEPDDSTYWHGQFRMPGGEVIGPSRHGNESRLRMRLSMLEQVVGGRGGARECRVLDVGCADGFFSFAASGWGAREVVGLDVNEEEIRKARWLAQRLPHGKMKFVVGDLRSLTLEDYGAFDLVLCLGVLYHFHDLSDLLERLSAIAFPGLILDTDVLPLSGRLALLEYETNRPWGAGTPVWVPTESALLLLAAHAGFRSYSIVEVNRHAPIDYRSRRRLMIYFSKNLDGHHRLLDLSDAARPPDDHKSTPFSWRYRLGSAAYRWLRVSHRALDGITLRW